ncbi:MAG: molybdopterin-dependent oxidoreductase [Deltaproteobacteria bacterium]|nr:molybdopterin-dependent oxidoreductase [Deltaproteobacteria bacterium]
MKLDRRGFIKFTVGAAAGIPLTPLPWKLMDDVAIWTQGWSWLPRLPRYPKLSYANTICTLCEGGCGISVRLVGKEKSIKIEGMETAPVNQGRICPIGAAGPQYQYTPARVKGPMRRRGDRDSSDLVQISWNDALREVGSRLSGLRKKGQAHTVVMISGRKNTLTRTLAEYFLEAYGSPNLVDMPSLAIGRDFADRVQFGRTGDVGYDLENSDFILSFGCSFIEGWGSPVRSLRVFSNGRANNQKLVQIDTRASVTASKADNWVAVRPGTETALALGLAHVLITQGLYDRGFIQAHTTGFDEFKEMVLNEYSPQTVSDITGVPAVKIIDLAKQFAQAKSPLAIAGAGRGDMPSPVYELMAVQTLNALKGGINRKGGVIIRKDVPLTAWPGPGMDKLAEQSLAYPRLDHAGSDKYPLTGSLLQDLIDAVNGPAPYPVNVLILDRADPAFFGADPEAFRAALKKIPFVVSLSSMMDDTASLADVILPESSQFEGPVDVVNPPTLPYPLFGVAGPVIPTDRFDTRPVGDIYLGLAKAVGGNVSKGMPFKSHRQMLAYSVNGLYKSRRGKLADWRDEPVYRGPEKTDEPESKKSKKAFFQDLADGLFWYDPEIDYNNLQDAFQTPSRKFEFFSGTLKRSMRKFIEGNPATTVQNRLGLTKSLDQIPLPHYEPVIAAAKTGEYPLLLVPAEQFKMVSGALGNAPYLTKLLEDITLKGNDLGVEINPKTAASLGLKEGDRALLKTKNGEAKVMVHLFGGIQPEVVSAPVGLGHNGFGYYLEGKGVNPMEIVVAKADPLSGQMLWRGSRASLAKV